MDINTIITTWIAPIVTGDVYKRQIIDIGYLGNPLPVFVDNCYVVPLLAKLLNESTAYLAASDRSLLVYTA